MIDNPILHEEPTAVDDVRRAREALDRVSGGDLRKHVEQTNAAYEELRRKFGLKPVTSPPASARPQVANG